MANKNKNKNTNTIEDFLADLNWRFIGCVVVVAALIIGFVATSFVKGTPNFVKWFDKSEGEQTEELPDDGDNEGAQSGNDLIITDDGDKTGPMKLILTRIATPVGGENHLSYKITAEVTPAVTTDSLDITLTWEDPSSEWATGKDVSDYITLEHEDGAFEATLTADQAYGETVLLTGKIRDRDVSDTIKLDYLKTITNDDYSSILNLDTFKIGESLSISLNDSDFSVGSVYPSRIEVSLVIQLNSSVKNSLTQQGFEVKSTTVTKNLENYTENNETIKFGYSDIIEYSLDLFNDGNDETDFTVALYKALSSDDVNLGITVKYYATNQGKEVLIDTLGDGYDFPIDKRSLEIPTTDVDLGGDFVFWV